MPVGARDRRRSPSRLALTALLGLCASLLAGRALAQGQDYHIGPNDVLAITDFDQADLSGNYTVDSDGTFTFPFVGQVRAGGLTVQQLQAALKKKLADGFFKDPQLNVAIAQYHSQHVYVVGEVRTPGLYTMTGPMQLIEAIAMAGSALPTASDEIMVVRPKAAAAGGPVLPTDEDDPADVVKLSLKALQTGSVAPAIDLRDGDTVFVPRADTIYVFGQVKSPGAYPVQPTTTVLQALSLAGGVTDRGSTGRVRIVRFVNGKKEELKVELGDLVKPGDTLMVPQRFF